jgi:hypothetical protein
MKLKQIASMDEGDCSTGNCSTVVSPYRFGLGENAYKHLTTPKFKGVAI